MPVIHTPTVYKCDVCQCRAEGIGDHGTWAPRGWSTTYGGTRCPVHQQDIDAHLEAFRAWMALYSQRRLVIMTSARERIEEWEQANPPPVAPWER